MQQYIEARIHVTTGVLIQAVVQPTVQRVVKCKHLLRMIRLRLKLAENQCNKGSPNID